MIRQTRNYLKGAVSGTVLVAVAIVAFVVLVSLQTLRDWPFAGLVGGSDAESTSVEDRGAQDATAEAVPGPTGAAGSEGGTARSHGSDGGDTAPEAGAPGGDPEGPDTPVSSPGAAGEGPAPGGSGDRASNGGRGSGRRPSGGGSNRQPPSVGGGGESVSETVTGAVNEIVKGADDATGGALGAADVTKTTEGAVGAVAGPDSTVRNSVDRANDTVGGAPGGDD